MSDQETDAGQTNPRELKKRIVPFDEDNPSIEPLFINCVQGSILGDDIFLDVGVVTLESLDPKMSAGNLGEFAVISRLAMSRRTALMARDQLNFVLGKEESASGEFPHAGS